MFWVVIITELFCFIWLARLVYKNWNTHFKEAKGMVICTMLALPLLIIAQLISY